MNLCFEYSIGVRNKCSVNDIRLYTGAGDANHRQKDDAKLRQQNFTLPRF
jgi:hypothetical protein